MKPKFERFKLQDVDGLAIYSYDENIRSKLYQLKGCGDIELAPVFLEYFRWYLFLNFYGYYLVPAPSSKDHDEERGFNHVKEIFKFMPNQMIDCVIKTKDIKQADLNAKERTKIGEYLAFDESKSVLDKKILLVDDVLTTGSTLKAMILLMKKHGAKRIKVLVMSHTAKQDNLR